ncbi:MAG: ATP synthase F1 subunit epsilon [Proteobacteria bacterium]|nr:ATP synthase F1 subunit epsilon [Pseudomonadota bacterium]
MAANFDLKVLSPSRVLVTGKAVALTVPGTAGYMTILPGHASIVAELDVGEVTLTATDGTVDHYFMAGGYVELEADRLTLLADVIETCREIDSSRAEAAKKRALGRLENLSPDVDIERANRALKRAEHRVLLAQTLASIAKS